MGFSEQFCKLLKLKRGRGCGNPGLAAKLDGSIDTRGLEACNWQLRSRCLVGRGAWCPVSVRTEVDYGLLGNGGPKSWRVRVWCWRC